MLEWIKMNYVHCYGIAKIIKDKHDVNKRKYKHLSLPLWRGSVITDVVFVHDLECMCLLLTGCVNAEVTFSFIFADLSTLLQRGRSWLVGSCHIICCELVSFWKVEIFDLSTADTRLEKKKALLSICATACRASIENNELKACKRRDMSAGSGWEYRANYRSVSPTNGARQNVSVNGQWLKSPPPFSVLQTESNHKVSDLGMRWPIRKSAEKQNKTTLEGRLAK